MAFTDRFHANKIVQTDDATNFTSRNLAVKADVKFPDSEVFGVKLINGRATRASLDFTNEEPEPVEIAIIGGALVTLDPLPPGAHPNTGIVRNLTSMKYGVSIPAGEKHNVPYSFTIDMNPQELRLQIMAIVQGQDGNIYQIQAFSETVSIVEPPTSIFDPQMCALIPPYSPIYANYYLVSSFTFSSLLLSLVLCILSTRPGSRHSFHELAEVERAGNVLSAQRNPYLPRTKPSTLTAQLSLPAPLPRKPTMRAGFLNTISIALEPSALRVVRLVKGSRRKRPKGNL
jgi:hypothetical protein